jgi:choline dehydrogenase
MLEFDVIVIGAGSAGCAVAGGLCGRSSLNVCLAEAGPDYGPLAGGRWPAELLDPRRRPDTHDWGYLEERTGEPPAAERRAKVIGGCSAHNQCAAVWPPPQDFDQWAAAGNPGWRASELVPLIEEIRRMVPTAPIEDAQLASWQRCFLHAALEAGFPRLADLSDTVPPDGVAPFHANIVNAVRWNAAFAFLDSVRIRRNLTIIGGTTADRLLLEGPTATGVVSLSDRGPVEVRARWFVLSAGAHGSPMILLRSGIGPADHLRELRIPVRFDRPGVGQNLHDHAGVRVRYEPGPAGHGAIGDDAMRLAQSQVILRSNSRSGKVAHALHLLPYLSVTGPEEWGHEIMAMNMAPRSRGRVRLRGIDPLLLPAIDFRLFSDPEGYDLASAAESLRLVRRLEQTPALQRYVKRRLGGAPAIDEVAAVDEYARREAIRYGHAVGTCRMGPAEDSLAVVDADGRVHGTSNVFVADASVMPHIPRANTNLTCFLIGLRMARYLERLTRQQATSA